MSTNDRKNPEDKKPSFRLVANNTNPAQWYRKQWTLVAEGGWMAGQHFTITGHVVLGRDTLCDITIPGKHLSRRHAELKADDNYLQIRDLGSANHTYVNGIETEEMALLPGDIVKFDVLTFRVYGPAQSSSATGSSKNSTQSLPPKKHGKLTSTRVIKAATAATTADNDNTNVSLKHQYQKSDQVSERQPSNSMYSENTSDNRQSIWSGIAILLAIVTVGVIIYLVTQI